MTLGLYTLLIRTFVLFLHFMLWLVLPGQAMAVCVNGNPSPVHEFQNSQLVFVGQVTAQSITPESNQYMEGITYSIRVTEVLRGKPPKVVRLFSENSSGRFPMEVDKTYLIFAHYELGRLQASNCGNSGELPEKAELLTKLRGLRR